jgi:hypothetical protein
VNQTRYSTPMTILKILFASIVCLKASACNTTPKSFVKSDESKASLHDYCERYASSDSLENIRPEICQNLQNIKQPTELQKLAKDFCGSKGQAFFAQYKRVLYAEAKVALTDSQKGPLSQRDLECAKNLAEYHVQYWHEMVADAQKESNGQSLMQLMDLPEKSESDSCWRLERMDASYCVVARPCPGTGMARTETLNISATSKRDPSFPSTVREGESITLCNERIRSIHAIKDPDFKNLPYDYAFANFLTINHYQARKTYGAANCHGTAQAVAGNFLDKTVADNITYHSPAVRQRCQSYAENAFAKAKVISIDGKVRAQDLPLNRGGFTINMNHRETCQESDCGHNSLNIFDCTNSGDLVANLAIDQMCVHCWDAKIRQAGYTRLPENAGWRDLKDNCILTANDHSVTTIYRNEGLCYYFESLAPFAAPQLNVRPCPVLFEQFPKRWCSSERFSFDYNPTKSPLP